MTIREQVSFFRNSINKVISDTTLTDRFLWSSLMTSYVSMFYRNDVKINSQQFATEILDTEEVDYLENTCVPLKCRKYRIPVQGIVGVNGLIHTFLGTITGNITFDLMQSEDIAVQSSYRFNTSPAAFYEEGYIYLEKYFPCVKVTYLKDYIRKPICGVKELQSPISQSVFNRVVLIATSSLQQRLGTRTDELRNKDSQG